VTIKNAVFWDVMSSGSLKNDDSEKYVAPSLGLKKTPGKNNGSSIDTTVELLSELNNNESICIYMRTYEP
jgi:hypothetical protein